jgi:hypothetical protein
MSLEARKLLEAAMSDLQEQKAAAMQIVLRITMDEYAAFMVGYIDTFRYDEDFTHMTFESSFRAFIGNMMDDVHDGGDHAEAITGSRYLAGLFGIEFQ